MLYTAIGEMWIMSKKKILFVIHSLSQGGIQHSLTNVLNAIDYSEYDVDLLVLFNKTDIIEQINKNVNITVCSDSHDYEKSPRGLLYYALSRVFKAVKNNGISLKFSEKERDFVRSRQINYIVNYFLPTKHYDTAIAYFYGYVADFVDKYISADKKTVFTHASIDEFPQLHERIFPHFDMIMTGSPAMASVITQAHPSLTNNIGILKYYIDSVSVRQKSKEFIPDFPDGGKIIISSCGRLSHEKGYILAVEAANLLKKNGYGFYWVHVGDGPEREKIDKKIKEYGLCDDFVILGMRDNPFPYVCNSDIFVQPSLLDGNPLSVEEAHILCVPVVQTATLGGRYMIKNGENGLLADISAESLYEKIGVMISDKSLRENIKKKLESIDRSHEADLYRKNVNAMLE